MVATHWDVAMKRSEREKERKREQERFTVHMKEKGEGGLLDVVKACWCAVDEKEQIILSWIFLEHKAAADGKGGGGREII